MTDACDAWCGDDNCLGGCGRAANAANWRQRMSKALNDTLPEMPPLPSEDQIGDAYNETVAGLGHDAFTAFKAGVEWCARTYALQAVEAMRKEIARLRAELADEKRLSHNLNVQNCLLMDGRNHDR